MENNSSGSVEFVNNLKFIGDSCGDDKDSDLNVEEKCDVSDKCRICDKVLGSYGVCTPGRGYKTLHEASKVRNDNLFPEETSFTEIKLHERCRLEYTKKRNLQKVIKSESNETISNFEPSITLRSNVAKFDFQKNCIFCGECACKVAESRLPKHRRRTIHDVTLKNVIDKWRKQAIAKNDDISKLFLHRVSGIIDLVAAEGCYHFDCYLSFQTRARTISGQGRPESKKKMYAFETLCNYLSECEDCQFSITELMQKMSELSGENDLFTEKYLQQKLVEKYGENLIVTEITGKCNVLTFREKASHIIHKNWHTEKYADFEEEKKRILQAAVAIINEDIKSYVYDTENYECSNDMKVTSEKQIPPLLNYFLTQLILGKNESEQKRRKCTGIAHTIVAACRPNTFISSLLLPVSVWLHKKYGSRQLIDVISKLGFAHSYKEVQNFEYSSLLHATPTVSEEGCIQFVFDNADINTCTLTGQGTFHFMGGIKCVTPASSVLHVTSLPRVKVLPPAAAIGEFGKIPITYHRQPPISTFRKTIFNPLPNTLTSCMTSVKNTLILDTLCSLGKHVNLKSAPSFNGFMQAVHRTPLDPIKSEIMFLPFINMSPTDPSTILSAINFAKEECRRIGQKFCALTFDQQLYIKAYEIISDLSNSESDIKVIVKLGGFHTLMSFLGSLGYIMKGSGLEELWETVYAKKTIPHMINGHAVARALRAHYLTHDALVSMLLQNNTQIAQEDVQKEISILHSDVMLKTKTLEDVSLSKTIINIQNDIEHALSSAASVSRTAMLWSQYCEAVKILKLFITAERLGDWNLHLQCIKRMIPYFHASAHHNYAKSAHLYLQSVDNLQNKLTDSEYEKFVTSFTIRRKNDNQWSAVATDLLIEQCLMRSIKVSGGLAGGRGVTESVVAKYIYSLPASITFTQPLEDFVGIRNSWSEQHDELGNTRMSTDNKDTALFLDFLIQHSPFDTDIPELRSIATGAVADENINCDTAVQTGERLLEFVIGREYGELHLKRSDRVLPIAATRKSVKIDEETIVVDPMQFFHRIICSAQKYDDLRESLTYELTTHSPALFDENINMRTSNKADLKEALLKVTGDVTDSVNDSDFYVIDGGYLLHHVTWQKLSKYSDIMQSYVNYLLKHFGTSCIVVFDGYDDIGKSSTKLQRQSVRYKSANRQQIKFENDMICAVSQKDFLSSAQNKSLLIKKLSEVLTNNGIGVSQAPADADVMIAETALNLATTKQHVTVVANDTDILVILLARCTTDHNIKFFSPSSKNSNTVIYNIGSMQKKLGITAKCLLFVHAMSGCDTTSSPYRKGKKTAMKLLHKTPALKDLALLFHEKDANVNEIVSAGEKFLLALYRGKETTLDSERYYSYNNLISKKLLDSNFDISVLPPTSAAAHQHTLRVYYQVQKWLGNELDPLSWGWCINGRNELSPVITLKSSAPEYLLKMVRCNCKADCTSMRCSCKKNGLQCTSMCGSCRGISCLNCTVDDLNDQTDLDNNREQPVQQRRGQRRKSIDDTILEKPRKQSNILIEMNSTL